MSCKWIIQYDNWYNNLTSSNKIIVKYKTEEYINIMHICISSYMTYLACDTLYKHSIKQYNH